MQATVHDVTRLAESRGFELVDVQREARGRDEEVTIRLKNPKPQTGACPGGWPFGLSVTLPGPVRSANHEAAVLGSRVSWQVPWCEYTRESAIALQVRYSPPRAG